MVPLMCPPANREQPYGRALTRAHGAHFSSRSSTLSIALLAACLFVLKQPWRHPNAYRCEAAVPICSRPGIFFASACSKHKYSSSTSVPHHRSGLLLEAGDARRQTVPTIGYSLSSEEHGPEDLVNFARRAEEVGFQYAMISDPFHPWIEKQGNSGFVWTVLGGIAQATTRLRVGTGVTCPTVRYHPAIIAQPAATVAG